MNIVYYKKIDGTVPVLDYIKTLDKKHKAKILKEIDLLEEYGFDLKEPYVKPIKGKKYNKLFELRTKFSTNLSRVFYFSHTKNGFILLSAYTKKTNKTDAKELDKALKYMNDYNERYGG